MLPVLFIPVLETIGKDEQVEMQARAGIVGSPVSGACDGAMCHLLLFRALPLDMPVCEQRIKFLIFL